MRSMPTVKALVILFVADEKHPQRLEGGGTDVGEQLVKPAVRSLLVSATVLDHHLRVTKHVDVTERIAVERDDVRVLANRK